MLFLTEAQFEARRALMSELRSGGANPERTMRRLLELDPDDYRALIEMGEIRLLAGDREEAERYYWAGLEAQPCALPGYLGLAMLYSETDIALSQGLTELGMRKLALQPDLARKLAGDQPEFFAQMDQVASELAPEEKLAVAAEALHSLTENEPPEVTGRLRRYRLIHEMQELDEMDDGVVDDILAEGRAMVPLLVGVLRGWGWMDLDPDEDEPTVERALALLGEVGGAEAIPHLLEFMSVESNTLIQAASWAWDRIIEAHPEEARQAMAELAQSADIPGSIAIAGKLLHHHDVDRGGAILDRLSEVPRDYTEEDADAFVSILMAATVGIRGKRAVAQARGILQRHRRFVSKEGLWAFEAVIAETAAGLLPPLPREKPDAPTIYEICAGAIEWADPEDEEDEDDDELIAIPEPVRRPQLPERNDPCWCGSGKKYKKCHLDADRGGAAGPGSTGKEFDGLRKRLADFMGEVVDAADGRRAIRQYLGDDEVELNKLTLVDWMIHDRMLPGLQRTVMQEFLRRHGDTLSRRERDLVESWSRSYVGLYEVQSVRKGSGFEAKDLLGDPEPFFVHDVSLSKQLIPWDGLMARMVEGERGQEVTGAGVVVPRPHLEPLRQWLHEDRKRTGLPWRDYLKRRHTDIRRQPGIIAEEWAESLHLVNTDGEELLFSKAVYEVADGEEMVEAMRASPDLMPDEEEPGVFRMLSANSTLLITFSVEGGTLTVECNSRKRLEMAKRTLKRLRIEGLRHVRDELTTQQEMKRKAMAGGAPKPAKLELPRAEVARIIEEHLEQHYGAWPDTKLPALGGKTPRQAAKTREGRKKLAEVLKGLENNEERKRRAGEPYYDASRLRRILGVYE